MKTLFVSLICLFIAFIPEYIAMLIYYLINPINFWQTLALFGVFAYFGLVFTIVFKAFMLWVWAELIYSIK